MGPRGLWYRDTYLDAASTEDMTHSPQRTPGMIRGCDNQDRLQPVLAGIAPESDHLTVRSSVDHLRHDRYAIRSYSTPHQLIRRLVNKTGVVLPVPKTVARGVHHSSGR